MTPHDLLALGWYLLPIRAGTKIPMDGAGLKHASTDIGTINQWAEQGCEWAVACEASGIIALDVDPRHGGELTWARLCERLGALPPHPIQTTRHGGWHHLLRDPGVALLGKMGDGVDVKRRGYILIEPSKGYRLTWKTPGSALPDLPPSWLEAAKKNHHPRTAGPLTFTGETTPYGRRAVEDEASAVAAAQKGERNNRLNVAAVALASLAAGGEIDPSDARSALYEAASSAGLGSTEIEKTIGSGWTYGSAQPRSAPRASRMPASLPMTVEAARWAGYVARSAGKSETISEQVADGLRSAFDSGVGIATSGGKVPKPPDVGDADAKRYRRLLKKSDDEDDPLPMRIDRIMRRPVANRATFDATITVGGKTAVLARLDGATIGSYSKVRDLVMEHCIVLPPAGKKIKDEWAEMLSEAFGRVEDVAVEVEESGLLAMRQEIAFTLLNTEVCTSEQDMHRGQVAQDPTGKTIYILPKCLVHRVRVRLDSDKPTREQVCDAARLLGMKPTRPTLDDGKRPRAWGFLIEDLERSLKSD